jgi:hypothetical protein
MTRADLIAAVRTASGKPMMSERECLAIVRGVLGVVREPSGWMVQVGAREIVASIGRAAFPEERAEDARHAFTAMIDALLGEIAE